MQPGVQVRNTTPRDLEAVSRLIGTLLPDDRNASGYVNNIIRSGTFNLAFCLDGKLVGYVTSLIDKASGGPALWQRVRPYIGFVGVDPAYRDQYIGRTLLSELCDAIFQQTAFESVYLECADGLAAFYRKCGFRQLNFREIQSLSGTDRYKGNIFVRERGAREGVSP